jgi:hypothetical protein
MSYHDEQAESDALDDLCDRPREPRIEVARSTLWSRSPGRTRAASNYYECTGPDGRRFTNTSIVTLREVLRSRYPGVTIVEGWSTNRGS